MEIKEMTALEMSRAVRSGEIGAGEAVRECFRQIEAQDGTLHAFLETDAEKAEKRAGEVEKGIREGRYTGPLAGVPVAVKDNICTKGRRTTCASRMLENFCPTYDAWAVRQMEEAGMILIGKTNMDEFAMGSTSETSAFGPVRNPWNTDKVPGGSSGGSCAAVAAGEVPVSLGSDTGGSIRQPAAFCGVAGLKPTYGTVSRNGLIAYASSLDQIGTIGKDISDCAALLEVITGHDKKDSTSLKRGKLMLLEGLEKEAHRAVRGMRIGIVREYLVKGLDWDVKAAIIRAAELLEKQGASVEFCSLGMTEYVIPAYYIIASAEASSNLARFDGVKYGWRTEQYEELHEMYKKTRAEGFGEEVKRRIMLGSFVLSAGYYDAYYLKALQTRRLIQKAFTDVMETYDLLIAPAFPTTPPALFRSLQNPLQMYLSDIYTVGVNMAGLPAACVPCGLDKSGMPVGLQLIGRLFQEKQIVQAAYVYECARGPFQMPGKEKVYEKAV